MTARHPVGTFALDYTPMRMRRRALGLTLRHLGVTTGIHYQTCWEIETNRQEPTTRQLVTISRALGVPTHELFAVREAR